MHLNGRVTPSLLARLRGDLSAARFTVEALGALWGPDAAAALFRGHRAPALRALDRLPTTAAVTLARLFVLALPVGSDALTAALPSLGVDGARELGLVDGTTTLAPLLDLRPYDFVDADGAGSWWIASDLGELATGAALREDHVLGVGGASLTLSGLMMADPVDSVLDLGTGCGIQAMHAARHAGRVVATDISQRALDIAAFNAELNDIHTIEFRLGSLYEPVAGERFDRIVSNPPFVITPRRPDVPAYEYRDGGLVGDAIVAAVVGGAVEHLTPGGVAQLLGNWEYRDGEDGLERVAGWADAAGLDAWLVERETQDPALYAETWIRDGGTRSHSADFDRLTAAWLDDFEERGVIRVGFGYLTLRRPTATRSLRRLERLDGSTASALGPHLSACIAAHDWQAGLDDGALLRATLTTATDVTEERHYWPGAEDPTVMILHQGGGFGRTVALDTGLAAFVGACDGELSVRAIIAAIAQLLEVDEVALVGELVPRVRELLVTGFLHR
jgi:methylase of polypeptide subunit release factors